MASNQNRPNVPSNAEVIATFERLLLQANSAKASKWSVRTLDRALGWALLAEKAQPGSKFKAQNELTKSLLENPFAADTVKEKCMEFLKPRIEESALRELAEKIAESDKLCKEAHEQIIKLELDENQIMDRIIAKEALEKCRNSEEDRDCTINHITKNCHEPWANVLCWMVIFSLPSDAWVHELFRNLHGSLQHKCNSSLESRARAKLETILS